MMMHPMLEAVFGAFELAGVRWCVLWGETKLADPTGAVNDEAFSVAIQASRSYKKGR